MPNRIGHYEVLGDLGSGGMSQIFRARDARLGREVAIKILSDELVRDASAVERFLREARAASALNHPNIVTIFEAGEESGQHFIAMELIRGRTLRNVIADEQRALDALPDVTAQIARALSAAHEAGIVHRDIKPDNIMVRDDGYVKVVDFGIARLLSSNADDAMGASETRTGSVVGTPRYMSPEQIGGDEITSASDIFSLGVILYEWVTGQHPFPAESTMKMMFAIMSLAPVAPSHLNPVITAHLEELLLDMLHKEPDQRPTASHVIQRIAPQRTSRTLTRKSVRARTEAPTVGRRAERRLLLDALARVATDRGLLVGIAGEPGMGKTSLVDEVLAELETDPHPWFIARGRCSERLAGSEAYLPILEALDSLLHADGRETSGHLMKSVAPTWYGQVSVLTPTSGNAEERKATSQERLKRELVAFLSELSEVRPVVLFLEDMHWADASTLDLLSYIASHLDRVRMRIVATYRAAELQLTGHPFLGLRRELEGRGLADEVVLSFLTREHIGEYLRLVFPRNRFPDSLAGVIHARTEGNPLFMRDLVGDLRDRNVIARDGEEWIVTQDITAFANDLPASIRSMVQRKIDALGKSDREMLVVASVQGVRFDTTIVARALGTDAAALEERLDTLEQSHALVELVGEAALPDGTPSSQFRFVHALYQNGLYASLRPVRKAALSGTIARTLAGACAKDLASVAAELALLFETARDFVNAARHFSAAARRAADVFADKEAIGLARRGLSALSSLSMSEMLVSLELELQLALGKSLIRTQGYAVPEVERAYSRARELCKLGGDPLRLCLVLHGLWQFFCVKGDLRKGTILAEQLLAQARESGDSQLLAIAHRTFGTPYLQRARYADCLEHVQQAVELTDPTQVKRVASLTGTDIQTGALTWAALCRWLLGYPDQATELMTRALDNANRLDLPFPKAHALAIAAWLGHYNGAPEEVFAYADGVITIARERQFEYWMLVGSVFRGWATAKLGRRSEGLVELQRGITGFRTAGAELNLPHFLALLADVLRDDGRPGESLAAVDEALAVAARNDDRMWEPCLHVQRAQLLREARRVAEAEEALRLAVSVAREQHARLPELRAATALARLTHEQGRGADARASLETLHRSFANGVAQRDLADAAALLAELPAT